MLLLLVACAHHIADPGPLLARPDPAAVAPTLKVCWVEFARGRLPHGFAVAHGALREDPEATQSGLLLVHPGGSWLLDGGSAAELDAHLSEVHGLRRFFLGRAAAGWTEVAAPADAVRAAGVDPAHLTGAIPTHGHFDHIGGLLDLPGVPIWLPEPELAAARAGGGAVFLPAEARALLPRTQVLTLPDGPFRYWAESRDLYGDGSVVLFAMPGHTPGSLGARVHLPDGRTVLLVGDTVWVREGYEQREPKGSLAASFDADGDLNDTQIQRLWSLHRDDPAVAILPAHDRRAWVDTFGAPGCFVPVPTPLPDPVPPVGTAAPG